MRKVLNIIDGDEYYGVQYPRTSDGDLFRVGDNDLDFCCMWRLRSDLRSFMEILYRRNLRR